MFMGVYLSYLDFMQEIRTHGGRTAPPACARIIVLAYETKSCSDFFVWLLPSRVANNMMVVLQRNFGIRHEKHMQKVFYSDMRGRRGFIRTSPGRSHE